jgi:hypothetical protein
MLALWGFTVDDAWITARVAHHLATGIGHRFNVDGPVVDAVTPLGYAHLLAAFAGTGPLSAFAAARFLGALAWLAAAAWLGRTIFLGGQRLLRLAPLLLLAISVPIGAWTTSGMETGLVTLLATLALAPHPWAPLAAGLAAAWRPELLPWAMALGIGTALARTRAPLPALFGLSLALSPAALVALTRFAWFGSAMPLAALAKPAGLEDGLRHAASGFLLTALPVFALAPGVARRLPPHELAVGVAAFVHLPAVALAGGDWMPSFRLFVPVLPAFAWVGAALAERAATWATLTRLAVALGLSALLARDVGLSSRNVVEQRLALVDAGRVALAGARRVATLDAGWVGVATRAHVVDLAGVTDPTVAVLPGGHTSKRLDDGWLDRREIDAVVALWDDRRSNWYRRNDARLADWAERAGFVGGPELVLRGSSYRYRVYRRPASRD